MNEKDKDFKQQYEKIARREVNTVDEADQLLSDLLNLIANKCLELETRIEIFEEKEED